MRLRTELDKQFDEEVKAKYEELLKQSSSGKVNLLDLLELI